MTTKTAQHTPGPWTVEQHGDYLDVFPVDPGWGYGEVCRIEHSDITPPALQAVAESNACLISCAPELLDALEKLVQAFISSENPAVDLVNAQAAVRKARGL